MKYLSNFKLFESEYKKGNIKAIYRDNKMNIIVPKSAKASEISCRGTNWCSKGEAGYKYWNEEFFLFRILFKDGYKLRLTWSRKENKGSWGSGGKKYYEIDFGDSFPFNFENLDEEITSYYEYNIDKIENYPDHKKRLESYNEIYDIQKEIINRVKSIPIEAVNKILEYRNGN